MGEKVEHLILKKVGDNSPDYLSAKKIIDRQTEALIEEMESLEVKLDKFDRNHRLYDIFSFPGFMSDEDFKIFVEKWKDQVRKKTNLLTPLDELGIRVFCDDLENQPAFPGIKIEFESEEILERNVRNLESIVGLAYGSKEVKINGQKMPVRIQMHYFLRTGEIDPLSSTVIHELVHQKHFFMNKGVSPMLTEVQAHYSSILESGDLFAPSQIMEILTDKKGSYKFKKKSVRGAVDAVTVLLGLGFDYHHVAQIISKSDYDYKARKYLPLESEAEKILESNKLDSLDEFALDLLYRMYVTNQRLKARILLYESIEEEFSLEKLRTAKMASLRGKIVASTFQYDYNGKPKDKNFELGQRGLCPMNKEFPYDITGLRTSIQFGMVMRGKSLAFRIGRFEIKDKEETLVWADKPEDISHLLGIVKDLAGEVDFQEKSLLFLFYLSNGLLQSDSMEFFQFLCTEEEREKIIGGTIDHTSRVLKLALSELTSISKYTNWYQLPDNRDKIKAYAAWADYYLDLIAQLGSAGDKLRTEIQPMIEGIKMIIDPIKDLVPKKSKSVKNKKY
ncbi:MAG: hypothetical protein HY225_03710 [Candidatus Vogelbacteria bacterium]|nr:hypothetical protein [Candidatus Vogelbacteria bacterium]